MKKKSLVAMGLAGVMTIGMCVPVLAEGDNEFGKTDSAAKGTEISVTNPVKYKVTIPSTINLENESNELLITLSNTAGELTLEKDKNVTITMGGVAEGKITLEKEGDATDTVTSEISLNKIEVDATNNIATCTIKKPTFSYAGVYKGTVNFTIAYDGNSAL